MQVQAPVYRERPLIPIVAWTLAKNVLTRPSTKTLVNEKPARTMIMVKRAEGHHGLLTTHEPTDASIALQTLISFALMPTGQEGIVFERRGVSSRAG